MISSAMEQLLTVSQESSTIGCGAMDWIFEQTDKIENSYQKLLTYAMALAVMQDKIKVAREVIRATDPELDSIISEALVRFAEARAANG